MWLRKIRYKKLQYIFMSIILAAASMIFFASIAFTREVNTTVERFYAQSNTSDFIITAQGGAHEQLRNNEVMSEIKETHFYSGRSFNEIIELNGTTYSASAKLFPLQSVNDFEFKMTIKESIGNATCPKRGEVWLSYTYGNTNGIKTGDMLTLGTKGSFKVSGFVISPVTASPFFAYYPYFLNEGDYSNFSESEAHELILINCLDDKLSEEHYELLNKIIEIIGNKTQSATRTVGLANDDTMTVNISGNIGVAASLIMFIAALIVIACIIRSNLQRELKNIGIYKSLGVTNRKIKSIYFKGYLLIGVVASILGIFAGLPVVWAMCAPAVKNIAVFSLSSVSFVCGIISAVILTMMLAVALFIVLSKIDKVKPVETINMGVRSNAKKLKKSMIKSARSPLSLAINEIFKYRASSVVAIIMIVLSVFMAYTFGGIGHSMSFLSTKTGVYGAMPGGDAFIVNNSDLYGQLNNRQDVESVIKFERKYLKLSINDEFISFNVDILSTFEPTVSGLVYNRGREPRTNDEIAIHADMLKDLGLKVNDYVKMSAGDKISKSYLVVGSFGAMLGSSNTLQLTSDSDICAETSEPAIFTMLCIKLKNGVTFDDFRRNINAEYGVLAVEYHPFLKQMSDMIYDIVKTPVNIMIIIFMTFSVLIITNLLFMNYMDNKKSFGTLKTLGLTTKYITLKNLCKMLILAGLGLIFGLLLGFLIAPHIYGWATFTSTFAFDFSLALPLVITGALIALVMAITILFSIPINKIKSTILMEE